MAKSLEAGASVDVFLRKESDITVVSTLWMTGALPSANLIMGEKQGLSRLRQGSVEGSPSLSEAPRAGLWFCKHSDWNRL